MPKQFFGKSFGDSGFKTIVTKDSKNAETGHISSEIIEQLTLKADDGAYISSDPSTGEILLSSALSWGDTGDGERIKMFQNRDKMTSDGSLAFEEGGGVFRKINGVAKSIAPGFVSNGDTFPNSSRRGTFWMNSANQLFVNAGTNQWLRLGTSIVSTQNPNLWNESGAHMTSVADVNNYYANSNVEDILAEMADRMPLYFTRRDSLAEEGISGGHLVATEPNYNWESDTSNINELKAPTGEYYINRKDIGVKLGKPTELVYDGKKYENPREFTMYLKHDENIDEMATKSEVKWLVENVGKAKMAMPDTDDLWSEIGIYNGKDQNINWVSAAKQGYPLDKSVYQLGKEIIAHRLPFSGMKPRLDEDRNISPYNYVRNLDDSGMYSLDPIHNSRSDAGRPALNESIRRYIQNNDYITGSSFSMDLNTFQNKKGFEIHYSDRDATTGLPTSKRNIFSVDQNNVTFGESNKDNNPNVIFNNKKTVFAGDVELGKDANSKVTFNGTLKVAGGLSQGSDLYFDIKGVDVAPNGTIVDESVVNIGFRSTDGQIKTYIRADSRNKQDPNQKENNKSNIFYTDHRDMYRYSCLGKFGMVSDTEGCWFFKNETTYNFGDDVSKSEQLADRVKQLDGQIGKLKQAGKDKTEEYNKLVKERQSLLRATQRSSMTTLGGNGQTMVKSMNSKVILRADLEADPKQSYYKFTDKVVALASHGYTAFTALTNDVDAALMMGAGPAKEFGKDVSENYYQAPDNKVGTFLVSQKRRPNGFSRSNLQPMYFISNNEYHNVKNGIFQVDGGQQWNTSFIAIGARPIVTEFDIKGGKSKKNYGDATGYGHLRIYGHKPSKTNSNTNDYGKIWFDNDTHLMHIDFVEELIHDYAKTHAGGLVVGNLHPDEIIVKAGVLDKKNAIGLIKYVKDLEARVAKLEKGKK